MSARKNGAMAGFVVVVALWGFMVGRDLAQMDEAERRLNDAMRDLQANRPRKRHWMIDGFWWETYQGVITISSVFLLCFGTILAVYLLEAGIL